MSVLGLGSAPMYGLKLPARVLCSSGGWVGAGAGAGASTSSHTFIVGTCSAKEENELQLLEFDEQAHEVRATQVLTHQQEVWHLAACPHDATICATTYPLDSSTWQSTLWRIPSLSPPGSGAGTAPSNALQRLVDLKGHVGRVKGVVWNPAEAERCVVSLDSQCMRVWELNESSTELKTPTATLTPALDGGPSAACWDPHHSRLLASADGRHVKTWDLRAGSSSEAGPTSRLDFAHEDLVTDVDYNPNRPFFLASCGADRRTRLWDLRSPSQPLKTLQGHTHWVASARFNRFHDQLLLSAGTERTNLWNLLSVSSAPVGELEHQPQGSISRDVLLKSYSDHEDSVYSAAWSSHDAWVFATLSYDGRVVINHVPPAEKYRILL